MNKVTTVESVIHHIRDGCTLMFSGFGGIGNPPTLIQAILAAGIKDLTLIGNDSGFPQVGIGQLITEKRAKKLIASHIGSNPNAGKQMHEGTLEIEFSPQGTLVERIRAGGMGLGGILVDIGIDGLVAETKLCASVDGQGLLVEQPLTGDVSIVYAKKADTVGNLIYDKAARKTSHLVAMAGDVTIVEVEEIVPIGELDPEEI